MPSNGQHLLAMHDLLSPANTTVQWITAAPFQLCWSLTNAAAMALVTPFINPIQSPVSTLFRDMYQFSDWLLPPHRPNLYDIHIRCILSAWPAVKPVIQLSCE